MLVSREDDPRVIVMGSEVDREASALFERSRGREPTAEELAALRRAWLDNEILYREGLALQVDRGDTTIRERVIFKALSVIDAGLTRPPIEEEALRAWFEARRDRYDEPPRFDFEEAVPAGAPTEASVRALVELLDKGAGGEIDASLRVFKGRPRANLEHSYGPDFARALAEAPPGRWRAYSTPGGWHAMRLVSVAEGKPADFERLRGVVLQDWIDATMAEQRTAAVRALARKYVVRTEAAAK
jgi:hypothetical protein